MTRRVLSLAALVLVAVSATASAQRSTMAVHSSPSARDGFTMSFGLANGSAGFSCSTCGTDRENGLSGFLSMGGAMSPTLVLGGELNGWSKNKDGATTRIGFLTGYAQWYPSATNGFYVKPGLGMGKTTVDDKSIVPANKLEATGFAYQIGTGYDFHMGRNWAVSPYANYLATTRSTQKLNGTSVNEKVSTNNFQVGLGLTWF